MLQQRFPHPWCFIGDFNTILGAHEHNGAASPSRQPIEDFQTWTDSNFLIHLDTSGAFYTWSNGREGQRFTERRLDRAICNQEWTFKVRFNLGVTLMLLDPWKKMLSVILTRPLIDKKNFGEKKLELIGILKEHSFVEEVIPNLVSDSVNALLTSLPSFDEIKNAVFSLNKDSAPGPDGFGGFFYQTYWDIIHKDVVNAVLQFFSSGWILPNFNSNTLILIPKTSNADSIDQYRPIALANFNFKIISKVLADRLAKIMPTIISKEQRGFIQDRNIKDCICLASEAINLLHNKSYGGNVAMKIDISKAFDTLEWPFLLKVLKQFGFNSTFCHWIEVILSSAHLSISINGTLNGYFNCSRGVRQGDPLSPLLFCLAEEVLSRGISKLVFEGSLDLIKGSRNSLVPSHCLYADDIMVFCSGKIACLNVLKNLFVRYANCSGQSINASKSTIYSGGISYVRLQNIVNLFGFKVGSLPFNYLGAPIFKGRPKARYFQPIADKIKSKLSSWKASLLSIAGRVQLIKSVIQSMTIYSITIYSWPISIIKSIESWTRNFIWSGNINQKKLVTVAWKKVCTPFEEGGLGLRSLVVLNEAANLKLCWDLLHSQEDCALILKNRVIRNDNVVKYHVYSSLWSSIKQEVSVILDNSSWKVGSGTSIKLWTDVWCGNVLTDTLNIHSNTLLWLPSLVSGIIHNQQWNIPQYLDFMFPSLKTLVQQITLPVEPLSDEL
ncbi:ribonuclease H, partial [Trifolium pratense]